MAEVKGTSEFAKQAEEGLKLFKQAEEETTVDNDGAAAYKEEVEKRLAEFDTEIAGLAGKDNKKKRTEKEKEKAALKTEPKYIDACKVAKGLPPPNGNFITVVASAKIDEPPAATPPAADSKDEAKEAKEKKDKPAKKMESTGISKAERDELEKLKTQIITRKTELKTQGMSGGQINKEEQIVQWVTRMNELKEKECPGSTTTKKDDDKTKKRGKMLDSDAQKRLDELQKEFEAYETSLRSEFGYSKKEIAADPDWQEKKAAIEKLKK